MDNKKIKIVIFDGVSGAGKTTLRYELFKKFNYNILTIDRFTPSIWAYDYLRGKDRAVDIKDIEIKMNLFDSYLVLCYCEPNIAKKRIRRDDLREVQFSPEQEIDAFEHYEKISLFKSVIIIHTENFSVDQCIEKICAKL